MRARPHRGHFALARGWIQGMLLPQLAERYLAGIAGDSGVDLRAAKTTLERVLDELAAAARRAGFAREAGALRRQAARSPNAHIARVRLVGRAVLFCSCPPA